MLFVLEFTLEGETIEIRQSPDDPSHAFLWVPSLQTVLGGIPLITGGHPWMADTPDLAAAEQWIVRLDDMAALNPAAAIPGHAYAGAGTDPSAIGWLRGYVSAWRDAAATAGTAADIVTAIKARYPDLPGDETLNMGAGVFTREIPWQVAPLFPAVGRKLRVDFGQVVFELSFTDNLNMTFVGIEGAFTGVTDTVAYTAINVAPQVWMVYWTEPHVGGNVAQVQNYSSGRIWTNFTLRDHSFTNLAGSLTLL